ncbi:phosphotransferase [Streptomyces sp. NPDC007861]|uniref:phosphotransferase n=1 Tax=Streptomyces sp. NPDC007861 TaxID=3154893 RepID=UPI0033D7856D
MVAEPVSVTRRPAPADELHVDPHCIKGPFRGSHHETYFFPVVSPETGLPVPVKCREPRAGLLWFDRRCFKSEEGLVQALRGRISSLPGIVLQTGGVSLQRFVEGATLGEAFGHTGPLPADVVRQLMRLVSELAAVRAGNLAADRTCQSADRPHDGDTQGFLERLVLFVEERVLRANSAEYGEIFTELGITDAALHHLRRRVSGLTRRPFCLLHGDLHRENLILDGHGKVWTIDWELAMVGDPLYDLATHLHLMRYPAAQAAEVTRAWAAAVEEALPGGSAGWYEDLDRLLAFKRAQSVFTDTIRSALTLAAAEPDRPLLDRTAARLHDVLAAAARPLGLAAVPSAWEIGNALTAWHKRSGAEAVPAVPAVPSVPAGASGH